VEVEAGLSHWQTPCEGLSVSDDKTKTAPQEDPLRKLAGPV
jgi:hypothetical protein